TRPTATAGGAPRPTWTAPARSEMAITAGTALRWRRPAPAAAVANRSPSLPGGATTSRSASTTVREATMTGQTRAEHVVIPQSQNAAQRHTKRTRPASAAARAPAVSLPARTSGAAATTIRAAETSRARPAHSHRGEMVTAAAYLAHRLLGSDALQGAGTDSCHL